MEKFWNKVRRGSDDECWEWLGCKCPLGYGRVSYGGKKSLLAHRVAWELTHDKIPEGLIVRHKCRGKCCNPAHLELGTQAENMRDTVRDGTSRKGELKPSSRLTNEQVREIKQRLLLYRRGLISSLAREFGVGHTTISEIYRGVRWSWLD